ncbi:hypothetical protein IT396_01470 [Candidatus Nomurabacteria bacterium]|nr:hypothetical protein [Candidatus Nomurabacteria bacterium]
MNTFNGILIGLIVAIVASAGSFYLGYSINPAVLGPYIAPNAVEGLPEGVVQILGTVESQEAGNLTVRLNTGEQRTVMLNEDTSVVVSVLAADLSVLIPGTEVLISAFEQQDGSLQTEYITVVPQDE